MLVTLSCIHTWSNICARFIEWKTIPRITWKWRNKLRCFFCWNFLLFNGNVIKKSRINYNLLNLFSQIFYHKKKLWTHWITCPDYMRIFWSKFSKVNSRHIHTCQVGMILQNLEQCFPQTPLTGPRLSFSIPSPDFGCILIHKYLINISSIWFVWVRLWYEISFNSFFYSLLS